LDPKNAASTGMKPVESHGPSLRLVATDYRPTGIKPVVANRRKKCFTALPKRGEGEKTHGFAPINKDFQSGVLRNVGKDEGCSHGR